MSQMEENKGWNLIPYTFSRFKDRPLGLLMMFSMQKITGTSSLTVLKFIPSLLGPALVLTMFYFMWEATQNWTVSSLTALVAAFSYPVTIGMLVGLLSNWTALIGVYLFSALMMKSMREKEWKWIILSASTLVLVLFTHLYTWAMVMGVLGVYTLLMIILRMREEKDVQWPLKNLIAILTCNVGVHFIRDLLSGSTGKAAAVAGSRLSLEFLPLFWSNLQKTLQTSLHKFYLNPLILLLTLIGAFLVCLRKKPVHHYLISWLIISSLFIVLGDYNAQWRILYNLPLPILATFGFDHILRFIDSFEILKINTLKLICILLVVLINANYGLRCTYQLLEIFVFN
ncbi:MAG: hypothetical protein ACOC6G_02830 [Thermoproteota archaeon]